MILFQSSLTRNTLTYFIILCWISMTCQYTGTFNGFNITIWIFNCITFTRLKLAKNQVKAKQHPKAKLFLLENYLLLHPKLIWDYSKKFAKNKCFNEIIWLIIMKITLKEQNGSHRDNINRIRPRLGGYKYTEDKMCPHVIMVMFISNTQSWFHGKVEKSGLGWK